MTIDAQCHVWQQRADFPFADAAAVNRAARSSLGHPPDFDATPRELMAEMALSAVDKAVLVQHISYLWDNRFVQTVTEGRSDMFAAVARVDPTDPALLVNATKTIDAGFRGVRISPTVDARGEWFDTPIIGELFELAQQRAFVVQLYTGVERLRTAHQHLRRAPACPVVIDHMADVDPTTPASWEPLLELAEFPNVYVKISHMWSLSHEAYPWLDTAPLVNEVTSRFGFDRIMWASDWPVSARYAAYNQTLSCMEYLLSDATASELSQALGLTALSLWFDRGQA